MPSYSVIVPVFNRPDEINELLLSLAGQDYSDFEVIIIEDGSIVECEQCVSNFSDRLNIRYFRKENTGQGFSRNFGAEKSVNDWIVFFDSDCIIPPNYFSNLNHLIDSNTISAYCGPDAASPDFSSLQKAISYSMTSIFTTGGIRGDKLSMDKTRNLRSYNMVVRKSIFEELKGFGKTNMGEDMEFSHRFNKAGFEAIVSSDLLVYHKRRNNIPSFFKQIFSFGRTRIILSREFGLPIKLVHYLPAVFLIGFIASFIWFVLGPVWPALGLLFSLIYFSAILIDCSIRWKNLKVGMLSVITSFVQLTAYGLGMIKEWIN